MYPFVHKCGLIALNRDGIFQDEKASNPIIQQEPRGRIMGAKALKLSGGRAASLPPCCSHAVSVKWEEQHPIALCES